MKETPFEINLPQFEGPFDLLLFFIERDELNIHDIPIAKITQDFLDYIQQMTALNVEIASEFIFVAATLMRIKARTLLPSNKADEEDEVDPKEDLIQKLIIYKQFKNICEELRTFEEKRGKMAKRKNIHLDLDRAAETKEYQEELQSFDLYKLMHVYERLMKNYHGRSQEVKHQVVQYPYTIEAQKKALADLLIINEKIDFQTLVKSSDNKVHFVYNFLAILEMLQQQLVDIQIQNGYNNFLVLGKNEDQN